MLGKNLEPQETIDEYNSWCIVWEPPGEQPAPWNDAKNSVPRELEEVPPPVAWGGSHTGIFPICIWTRPPYQTFPADPLRSQVSWTLGYGIEDLCRSKTPHPFCTPGRAIMSSPPPCARKTPSQSRMQLSICLYFCFNYLLFHWIFMEQIYVLGACNIGSMQHESHTDGNVTRESKKMIPITFKRTGAFTGRLAESWAGSPSCYTLLGWLGSVTSQIRRRVGSGQPTGCPSVAVDSSLVLPV